MGSKQSAPVTTKESDAKTLRKQLKKKRRSSVIDALRASRSSREFANDLNVQLGRTALHSAAQWGRTDIVRLLVGAKCDIEARDKYGQTALQIASINGHTDIVKLLLGAGCKIEARDKRGHVALHSASQWDRPDVVKALLDAGCDKEAQDESGKTPLLIASAQGHTKVVEILLAAWCNEDAHDKSGKTSLHVASSQGHVDVVKQLLNVGVNKEARDKNGWTALHWAVNNCHLDVVKLLLEAKCCVSAADKSGYTASHLTISNKDIFGKAKDIDADTIAVLQLLFRFSAQVDTKWYAMIVGDEAVPEARGLMLCVRLWERQLARKQEPTWIPLEVLKYGVENTKKYIDQVETYEHTVMTSPERTTRPHRQSEPSRLKRLWSAVVSAVTIPVVVSGVSLSAAWQWISNLWSW